MGTKPHKSTANILFVDQKTMLLVLNSKRVLQTSCSLISYVQGHGEHYAVGTNLHKSTENILFLDKETMLLVLNPIRVLQTYCLLIRRLCCWY